MSEAPERIWVDPKPIDLGSSDGPFFTVNGSLADIPFEGHTEYIRADISAALEARIAAADRLADAALGAIGTLNRTGSTHEMNVAKALKRHHAAYLATKGEPK